MRAYFNPENGHFFLEFNDDQDVAKIAMHLQFDQNSILIEHPAILLNLEYLLNGTLPWNEFEEKVRRDNNLVQQPPHSLSFFRLSRRRELRPLPELLQNLKTFLTPLGDIDNHDNPLFKYKSPEVATNNVENSEVVAHGLNLVFRRFNREVRDFQSNHRVTSRGRWFESMDNEMRRIYGPTPQVPPPVSPTPSASTTPTAAAPTIPTASAPTASADSPPGTPNMPTRPINPNFSPGQSSIVSNASSGPYAVPGESSDDQQSPPGPGLGGSSSC